MAKHAIIWSDCRECSKSTRHEIVFQIEDKNISFRLNQKDTWQIVRCLGCQTISFRFKFDDYNEIVMDYAENESHLIQTKVYPCIIKNHRNLSEFDTIPTLINKIYTQTAKSIAAGDYLIASMGLRACIEAVCNHVKISGSNLERRIDKLFKEGFVSNGDKKRLHAIRFLGNDAAHEIKESRSCDIITALEIVEHLITTVFILENRSKGLDMVIETYDDFIVFLSDAIVNCGGAEGISLRELLGKQVRQIGQNLEAFEAKLRKDIAKGIFPFICIANENRNGENGVARYNIDASCVPPDCASNYL